MCNRNFTLAILLAEIITLLALGESLLCINAVAADSGLSLTNVCFTPVCVSTGGGFVLRCQFPQPQASLVSTGGVYTLSTATCGRIGVVLTPGAPVLTIGRAGANIVVIWPYFSEGWKLEKSTAADGPIWVEVSGPFTDDGTSHRLYLSPRDESVYYRLRRY